MAEKGFWDSIIGLGDVFGESKPAAPVYSGSQDGTKSFRESGGVITEGGKAMSGGKVIGTYDKDTDIISDLPGSNTGSSSLMSDLGGLSTMAGTGFNIYSNLFGDNAELHDKKMEAMDTSIDLQKQQKKANKQAMADRSQFNSTWASASNGLGKIG